MVDPFCYDMLGYLGSHMPENIGRLLTFNLHEQGVDLDWKRF